MEYRNKIKKYTHYKTQNAHLLSDYKSDLYNTCLF